MAYHRHHGVEVRIVRIFNTFGPRMQLEDGRAIPNFIRQALAGEELTLYGDGSQTRSFCYVDDLVEGIWRLLGCDYVGPVNIGNPREMTVREMAEKGSFSFADQQIPNGELCAFFASWETIDRNERR